MKIYQNLTVIGTSHIAKESIKEVEQVISSQMPEIVALELDKNRLLSLLSKNRTKKLGLKEIRKIGIKGFIFGALGQWIERKIGNLAGSKPGDEMIMAFKTAEKFQCKVAVIDQNIEKTLKKLSKSITWREKWNFFVDIIKSFFKKNTIGFNLRKVPSKKIINRLLKETKKRYPNVFKILVEDRNKFMAKRLYRLMREYKSVVAVVGAGHVEEIIKEVKCSEKKS